MDNSNVECKGIVSKIEQNIIPATAIQRLEQFPIRSGGFSDIWKCCMSTQSGTRHVAIKAFRVLQHNREPETVQTFGQRIRREVNVWIRLSHDNILPLEGVTEGFGPLPALVTPWMENGSLNDYLRREVHLSEKKKLMMVREVAAGLQYLHDRNIVHGNLTGTNILVSGGGTLCIGDFGLSTILAESENTSFYMGNTRWMAPEVLTMDNVKPTKACDVYSYGCIMMQVFSGYQPYHSLRTEIAVIGAKMRGVAPFSQLTGVDEGIQRVAQQCWSREFERRPSVAEITDFFWSRTDIRETMNKFLLNLAVKSIPQTHLMECDRCADDVSDPSSNLKRMWVQESGITEVAVKTITDDVDSQNDLDKIHRRIRREIYVRERLRRETILDLYGMTTVGVLPSFVYPWMAGGSLYDYLKREYSNLPAHRKLDILVQVADGIKYLHKKDVAHGNLTGDNIFLDASNRIRIADFSRSVILAEADNRIFSEQLPGDARYVSPERIVHGDHTGALKPTKAGDVYSYGCVAILVLSGKVPYWWIPEESQVLVEKGRGTEPFLSNLEVDEVYLNLMRQCLSAEKSRPSIEKVLYSILVQSFGTVDLTDSIQRPNKDYCNSGGFAHVHACKVRVMDIDASVRAKVSNYYQRPSMTEYVDVAVKELILANDPDILKTVDRLFREIRLWLKLEHENIVPLWGVTDGFGSLPGLVSPWEENGALTGYLQRKHGMLSGDAKFALLRDVARGLQYLHSQSIIHGDLNGNNVLVDENGKASLTNFGLSTLLPGRMNQVLLPTNPSCTVLYMAPEYLTFDDKGNMTPDFTSKSDVYSFGGIMLQVLEGKVPYHYITRYESTIYHVLKGIRPKKPPASVVIDTHWDFIQRCWLEDADCRPSAGDILEFVEGQAGIQS